jgi:hypothetical protein
MRIEAALRWSSSMLSLPSLRLTRSVSDADAPSALSALIA